MAELPDIVTQAHCYLHGLSQYRRAKYGSKLTEGLANEVEKLRGIIRLQDAAIRSGDTAALTTAEREAVELAIAALCGSQDIGDTDGLDAAAALRELLDRHQQPAALSPMTIATGPDDDDEEEGRIWDSAKNKPD